MNPTSSTVSSMSSGERRSKRWPKIVYFIIVIVAIGSVVQNIRFERQISALKSSQGGANQPDLQAILGDIGKLMILPKGETPTVATVSDLSKLRDQPFFANAEVGDQVIIYATSKKAILWRPSAKKIVEVAPINVNGQQANDTQAQQAAAASTEQSAKPEPSKTKRP